jgi:crescentin
MARIWGRSGRSLTVSGGAETPQSEIAPPRYSPIASLETIGMHNETLRLQIESIELGFDHFEAVKGSFRGLLSPLSDLLADFEATKKRAHETKLKLNLLQDAHEALGARHKSALAEFDTVAEDRNAQQRENRELQQRAQRSETALAETQSELRDVAAARERLERLLESETRQTAARVEEVERLKTQLTSNDESIAGFEIAMKAAADEKALLSQDYAALHESWQTLSSKCDMVSQQFADAESSIDERDHRIAELEQALIGERTNHAGLRAKHLEHVERSRSEIAALGNTIQAVRGRADVAEKLLGDARGQLREKIDELRGAERRLLESGIQIDGLEKNARAMKDDLAAANERIASAERIRFDLADRANNLGNSLKSREAALRAAASKAEQLTARLEEAAKTALRDREEADRRALALKEAFEREHSARTLAEGALQASRAELQQARRSPAAASEIRQPEEGGENGGPPPPNNVTQLPRAGAF